MKHLGLILVLVIVYLVGVKYPGLGQKAFAAVGM